MKTKILFFCLIIFALFISCQDNEDELIRNQEYGNMLYFETIEDCISELNKVLGMNEQERIQWETSKDFKSLGLESEKFYANINPKKFKSAEEIMKYVEKNSDFLQLVEDGNGQYELDTRLSETPFRFLAN
jgi:hypothetical protein